MYTVSDKMREKNSLFKENGNKVRKCQNIQ